MPNPPVARPADLYDVRAFRALGDGHTLDTAAIQAAIDACHLAGGGTVHLPAGGRYLVGTIYLRSHVHLHLEANALLLGSTDIADYASDTGRCPYYPEPMDKCLIYAKGARNIALTGQGTIDGQFRGELFRQLPGTVGRDAIQRPMLLRIEDCENVQMSGLTLTGSAAWCTHWARSRDIRLHGLSIFNDQQDGFNIESCEDVTISDCNLRCGDDGIALTTNPVGRALRNLTVTNCLISSRWAAIRLGPLSKGDFANITVSNCVFRHCYGGGIKMSMWEGAEIRDCLFANIVMDDVTAPIALHLSDWEEIGTLDAEPRVMPVGRMRNLRFQGIRAIARTGPDRPWYPEERLRALQASGLPLDARADWAPLLFLHGHPSQDIENVTLSDVHITVPGGGSAEEAARRDMPDMDRTGTQGVWKEHSAVWGVMPACGLVARHVRGLTLDQVEIDLASPDARAPVFCIECSDLELSGLRTRGTDLSQAIVACRDCEDAFVHGCRPLDEAKTFLRAEGARSRGIALVGNDLRRVGECAALADGAPTEAVSAVDNALREV